MSTLKTENKKKSYLWIAVVLILLAGMVGGFLIALRQARGNDRTSPSQSRVDSAPEEAQSAPLETDDTSEDEDWNSVIEYQGETWKINNRLTTVLFMGIDSKASVESHNTVGNGGRADTILLFVLNKDTETMQLIQISRDTMTEVDVYDDDRDLIYSGVMQLTMQYAFGDSATRSCMLMKKTVSELLYGIDIDDYCALTIDGMGSIVDAMGGITVTLEDDWTDISPSYTKGATVTMDSAAVERFVRYRDIEVTGSNDTRMERQAWFLQELFHQMASKGGNELLSLYDAAGRDLTTDMDAETIRNMAKYTLDENTVKLPGHTVEGDLHDEYYLDEEALQDLLVNTFYVKVEE